MVIKTSSANEIRALVSALSGDDEIRRDAAIARLAVIGARAVDALERAYDRAAERTTKVAVLRALEAMADPRAAAIARRALAEGGDVAVAATSVLRSVLDSPHGRIGADALDALVGTALDARADRRLRLAAFDALRDMPDAVRAGVAEALAADPDPRLNTRALELPREAAAAESVWQDAIEGRLPESAGPLREAAQTRAATAPLGSVQKLIDAIRAREVSAPPRPRAEWLSLRGALHQALALRGSRVAVYDLRETLAQAAGPLPASFLAALHVVGDESCLASITAAYARGASDARWRAQLAAAFRAIAKRERLGSDLDFPFLAK